MNPPSVYERVLGARLDALDPGLRRYFGAIPPASVGVGTGVFVVAGSRLRWLRPVWAFLGWRRVLFAEHGRDVPFTVLNTPQPDGSLTADVRLTMPILGEVFRYAGTFTYAISPADAGGTACELRRNARTPQPIAGSGAEFATDCGVRVKRSPPRATSS